MIGCCSCLGSSSERSGWHSSHLGWHSARLGFQTWLLVWGGVLVEDREVGIGVRKSEFGAPRDVPVMACSTKIAEDKRPFIYSFSSLE